MLEKVWGKISKVIEKNLKHMKDQKKKIKKGFLIFSWRRFVKIWDPLILENQCCSPSKCKSLQSVKEKHRKLLETHGNSPNNFKSGLPTLEWLDNILFYYNSNNAPSISTSEAAQIFALPHRNLIQSLPKKYKNFNDSLEPLLWNIISFLRTKNKHKIE